MRKTTTTLSKTKSRRSPRSLQRLAGVLLTTCLALAPGVAPAQEPQTGPLVIRAVQVVDVVAGSVSPARDVLIDAGRIVTLDASAEQQAAARVVDGQGLFLMPGLWDMHAHIRHPRAADLIMPQFIANGVTGVREMSSECDGPEGGDFCLARMQQWRQQIADGELLGPRLLALSSFPFNPPWDYEMTEEQMRGVVAEMDNRGVDLIKTYFRLSPQAFRWLIDEATSRGLPVAGHLPMQMRAEEASRLGLRSLEHARDFLFDCYPDSSAFRASARTQNPEPAIRQQMVDGFDADQCSQTFATFAANDTWYVPTHVTRRLDAFAADPAFRNDNRLRYIWPEVRQQWQADADAMAEQSTTAADAGAMRAFYEKGLEITRLAHAAGVRILLGTDSGDSYSFFGFSVHDELEELVKAGLTPDEALAAATISAAEFLGLEGEYGSVAAGKVADLVLLRGNPIEDIDNSRRIEGVFFDGQLYDRQLLDGMLEEVAGVIAEL